VDKSSKPYKKKQKNQIPLVTAIIGVIIIAVIGVVYFFSIQTNSSVNNNQSSTPIITSNSNVSPSNPSNSSTVNSNTSTIKQNVSNSTSPVNVSINTTLPVNATLNSTQLCLNNSVYVGNFNLATRNLNYSWAPYYGIYYMRFYVDFSLNLNKPFVDVSDIFDFNGTHCSYTPVFEGQTVVLPDCSFIMKVDSISLVGGVWVANVDISHC
jgi:hypothetical protein